MARTTPYRTAALAALALVAVSLGVGTASAHVVNGDFADGPLAPWFTYGTSSAGIGDGQLCAATSASALWDAAIVQEDIDFAAGDKEIEVTLEGTGTYRLDVEAPEGAVVLSETVAVDGTETVTFGFTTPATEAGKVLIMIGGNGDDHTVCLDRVSTTDVAPTATDVLDEDFGAGHAGWWSYANVGAIALDSSTGALCVTADAANRWDAGIGFDGWPTPAGTATLTFVASGVGIYKVNVEVPDGTEMLGTEFALTAADALAPQSFTFPVVAGTGAIKFEVGGEPFCVDDIVLTVIEGDDGEDPVDPPLYAGVNLLANGDFSGGMGPWSTYGHAGAVTDGRYCGTVTGPLSNPWDAGVGYNGVELPPGDYVFSFDASTTGTFTALVQQDGGAYTTYASTPVSGPETTRYEVAFTIATTVPSANVQFHLGPLAGGASYDFCLDDVYLGAPAVEYVDNGDFTTTADPWEIDGADFTVDGGVLCVAVPGGTANPWDVNIHLDGLDLPAGPYALTFDASGTGGPMRALVGLGEAPWTVYAELNATPSDTLSPHALYFTMQNGSSNAQIAFQVGGASAPWTFCLDNVSLMSGGEAPGYEPQTGPAVKVNQHGYESAGPKRATLVTEATAPVAWELVNADSGVTHASGTTTPRGLDPTAGVTVHVIDFGGSHPAGTYVLRADGEESWPFTIASAQYAQLRYDALNYFYLARSGIEIEADIVGAEYARAAGHVSVAGGSDTNQGDYNVACQPASESAVVYGEPWTCDYTLDVVGGWYDAGDHGKYVVNGGISVAQVMGTYERLLRASAADRAALGDGSLNLPEHGNGVPDALDEARWQLDFMVSMMVPEGEPLAGMVHHKIHDFGWTGLPLLPVNGDPVRYLHRPSTAAALNVAATAAQGARLWQPYDAAYAQSLLDAAERTWQAALANPALYAPAADGNNGGGPYDDDDVTDEFYWAAAELFITTGQAEYERFLLDSPVHTANSFPTTGFSWDALDGIAKINLASVDNDFSDREAMAAQVIAGGEAIRAVQQSQPFGQALPEDGYVWGSNSQILNNIVVLGAAYDLTGDASFLNAALESMDYLLGRNVLGQSYITGYGTQDSRNQHSRWFAAQLNAEYPHPPAGSVAGGPNTTVSTWDPTFAALYPAADCAPQWCYVDHIQSWATNEITVNWNAALSWAVGFLAAPDAPVTLAGEGPGTGGPGSGGPGSGGSDDSGPTEGDLGPTPPDRADTSWLTAARPAGDAGAAPWASGLRWFGGLAVLAVALLGGWLWHRSRAA